MQQVRVRPMVEEMQGQGMKLRGFEKPHRGNHGSIQKHIAAESIYVSEI